MNIPFLFFSLLCAALLAAPFVPWARRQLAQLCCDLLRLFGAENKAPILACGVAWLLFCYGMSLLPLCAALYTPHATPGLLHVAGTALFVVLPLLILSTLACSLVTCRRWRRNAHGR